MLGRHDENTSDRCDFPPKVENLTAYRRRIMKEANKRRQEGTLLSVWSLDGKIFVKTSPYGSPVRIFSEEDLDQL